jgi:EAL domain-containing protein (putative c-di-GMP-specific phosphodiesterase class I)
MPEQLRSLVKLNQLDPAMLMLEMTESALMGEITTSLDILTKLRLKGFQLSIDDFGTGFSSLSQLHRIPFTELKVDQSFVTDMINDSQSCAIVETCIMLGHKLNMA